jgi:hypothetical protein
VQSSVAPALQRSCSNGKNVIFFYVLHSCTLRVCACLSEEEDYCKNLYGKVWWCPISKLMKPSPIGSKDGGRSQISTGRFAQLMVRFHCPTFGKLPMTSPSCNPPAACQLLLGVPLGLLQKIHKIQQSPLNLPKSKAEDEVCAVKVEKSKA